MFIDNEHISEINAFKTVQSNLLFQSKLRNFKKIIQDMKKHKNEKIQKLEIIRNKRINPFKNED